VERLYEECRRARQQSAEKVSRFRYNSRMTPILTDELRQTIAKQPGQPVYIEDPVTRARYVLVQLEVYERLQRAMDYDASAPDPRQFYPAFAEAVKDDLDAPGMELYDQDGPSKERS
jgi:hypothetical protein